MECGKLQEQLKNQEILIYTHCYNDERIKNNPKCIEYKYTLWYLKVEYEKYCQNIQLKS